MIVGLGVVRAVLGTAVVGVAVAVVGVAVGVLVVVVVGVGVGVPQQFAVQTVVLPFVNDTLYVWPAVVAATLTSAGVTGVKPALEAVFSLDHVGGAEREIVEVGVAVGIGARGEVLAATREGHCPARPGVPCPAVSSVLVTWMLTFGWL